MSAAATALEVVGIPAAILDGAGKVLTTNGLFDDYVPNVVQLRSGRMTLTNKSADGLLEDILPALRSPLAVSQVQSIPIPAVDDQSACIVHLYPLQASARRLQRSIDDRAADARKAADDTSRHHHSRTI